VRWSRICDNEPRRPRPGNFDPRIAVALQPLPERRLFVAVLERAREARGKKRCPFRRKPASTYISFTTSSDANTCTDCKRADTALHG
jgi:hypothetical protein